MLHELNYRVVDKSQGCISGISEALEQGSSKSGHDSQGRSTQQYLEDPLSVSCVNFVFSRDNFTSVRTFSSAYASDAL